MVQLTTRSLFEFEISIITDTCKLLQKCCCTRLIQLAKVKIENVPASKNGSVPLAHIHSYQLVPRDFSISTHQSENFILN